MVIISVENIGKKYLIRQVRDRHALAFREVVTERLRSAGRRILSFTTKKPRNSREEFWALEDLHFEIQKGDRLGIIGRNGAGKSTLLKILSRITEPTTGRITIRGRVASLLEVGTGFHPELTGRENIFLNGAILGMTRVEIRKKFDEIVDFADVEKFLDTPVKFYSSGMYVRLAFAVAAHLDPDILLIDEVLAVGDAQFQKKCLGKMEQVNNQEGRTILFVSHNMSMVQSFCSKGILLENGRLSLYQPIEQVVTAYLEKAFTAPTVRLLEHRTDRSGSGAVKATRFRVLSEAGEEQQVLQSGRTYFFAIDYRNYTNRKLDDVVVSLDIHDEKGVLLLLLRTNFTKSNLSLNGDGGCILCRVPNLPLANGLYRISTYISHADADVLDYLENAGVWHVEGGDFFGTGSQGIPRLCKVLYKAEWSTAASQPVLQLLGAASLSSAG